MQHKLLYEFPLNERTRTLMRLENYFQQIDHFSVNNTLWDSQACLFVLIDLLNIIDRSDIRSELIKELDRNIGVLNNLSDTPGINTGRLKQTLDELHTQLYALQNISKRIGSDLKDNELLNSVKQRLSISTNISCFEVPSFYFWLNQDPHKRREQISNWLNKIKILQDAIMLLNKLLRGSTVFESKTAYTGFFQEPLNVQQPCQMVRIALPQDAPYFPETSGSKHRISIRFLRSNNASSRPVQVEDDVTFDISCCSF